MAKEKYCPNCNTLFVGLIQTLENRYYYKCLNCGLKTETFKTKREAKDAWNRLSEE